MAASLSTAAERPAAASKVNILLVDDQASRRLTYGAILEPLGENLIEAASGKEALGMLMQNECAVILLDVNMPGLDGFETASLIHQHPRFERTPIIFVTAINLSDLDRIRGYSLGAVDYVTVPVIAEFLRSKVSVLCELHRKRLQLQTANEQLATANEALRTEKARELARLNQTLSVANQTLAARNEQLQSQIMVRENAEQRLLELGRRKDEFLAMLAHELRNPLASLGNAVNIIKLSADGDAALRRTMERQLAMLVRLIDDLLDAARMDRGKLTLEWTSTTLGAVLESAVETVAPLLTASRHPLHVEIPDEPVVLRADRERLAQVFSNLLSNAAKYSDAGAPIDLGARMTDDGIEVTVADRGIGLSAEQCRSIFEPFAQLDTSLVRAQGGLGIGLTLARHIVELHGGRIDVHSGGPGSGSRFSVVLPASQAEADSPAAPVAEAPAEVPARACRALVVDDNQDSADTMAMMLELLGHQARCVYDPTTSVQVALEFAPDVVFLDIGMPGMSGHDVARAMRAVPSLASLMLVAVTGWGQAEDRRLTQESGFDRHLVKPVRIEAIGEICQALGSVTE